MCQIVYKGDEEYIDNVGDLRRLWQVEPVYHPVYDGLDRNPLSCLCPVLIEETAKKAGVKIVYRDGDWEIVE